jgi:hypothetical protein
LSGVTHIVKVRKMSSSEFGMTSSSRICWQGQIRRWRQKIEAGEGSQSA